MVWLAFTRRVSPAMAPPVLGLRSKRGKLLLEISTRMRWPLRNALLAMPAVVVDGLVGLHQAGFAGDGAAGVGIAVEAREVAARNLHPDAMALEKRVAGDAGVEYDFVHVAGPHRLGPLQRVAVAQPQNAVGQ